MSVITTKSSLLLRELRELMASSQKPQTRLNNITSLIAMIVLSLALVIRIGVMVGVLLKLKREVKVGHLKYFGLISMVAQ